MGLRPILIVISTLISACSSHNDAPIEGENIQEISAFPRFSNMEWKLIKTTSDDGTENIVDIETRYQFTFMELERNVIFGSYSGYLNCTAIEGSYLFDNDILMVSLPVLDQASCFDFAELDILSNTIFEQGFSGRPIIVETTEELLSFQLENNSSLHFVPVIPP